MGYTFGMPWKETCVKDERTIMISEYLSGDYSISQLARRRGVSRKTVHKWVERYEQNSEEGLSDLSRAPRHHPNAIAQEMEQRILGWKARYPLWGAPKIHSKLRPLADCPAESTVSNVLQRWGLTRPVRRRRQSSVRAPSSEAPSGPNALWCADFKGWFRTGDGQRCDPLTISDAFSRYLLCCRGIRGTTGVVAVKPWFEATFRQYGMPRAIRTDNGSPFASMGLGGLSALSVWWVRLGIQLDRIEPGCPQQNGRHERMHRTLKEAVANPPRSNLRTQQQSFDAFRQEYNQERPHEALGQKPPASVYQPANRDFPERLREPEYPDEWLVRAVRQNGEIKWKGKKIYLNPALSGQPVGLEPVDDGVWRLHFMTVELGQFNERDGKVQSTP
jgi:transposase InsO family protein